MVAGQGVGTGPAILYKHKLLALAMILPLNFYKRIYLQVAIFAEPYNGHNSRWLGKKRTMLKEYTLALFIVAQNVLDFIL